MLDPVLFRDLTVSLLSEVGYTDVLSREFFTIFHSFRITSVRAVVKICYCALFKVKIF